MAGWLAASPAEPASAASVPEPASEVASAPAPVPAPEPATPPVVPPVVVEDEPVVRGLIVETLSELGYNIVWTFVWIAVGYLIITLTISALFHVMEKRWGVAR